MVVHRLEARFVGLAWKWTKHVYKDRMAIFDIESLKL
jgi:hypothetical protein